MFATVVVESPYLHMHTLGGPDQPNARPRIYSQFNTFHHIYTFPHIQSFCRKKNELKVFEKVEGGTTFNDFEVKSVQVES